MKRRKDGAGEHFGLRFQVTKSEGSTFEGMASVFGSLVDTFPPTIVDPGAFTKTLKENMGRIVLPYQHDRDDPIGVPIELRETAEGLFLKGKISDTQLGRDAVTLMKDGALKGLSIGFDAIKWEMEQLETDTGMPEFIRHLKEVRLWEISLVTFGADPEALVQTVHARPAMLPTSGAHAAPADYVWDAGSALARVRAWAGLPEGSGPVTVPNAIDRYASAFLSSDGATRFDHLVCDVFGGELHLVPEAVLLAGAATTRDAHAGRAGATPIRNRAKVADAIDVLKALLDFDPGNPDGKKQPPVPPDTKQDDEEAARKKYAATTTAMDMALRIAEMEALSHGVVLATP